jgi:Ca2+-binding EF-hand superfamily protein
MRVQNLYLVLLTVSLISVSGVVCGQDRENQEDRDKRRQFDHESYLNRIDDNKNGILEVDEMSERTKGWIRNYGLDTSRPVQIKSVMRKVNAKKSADAKFEKRERLEASRLVPGFGVEGESESEFSTVSDFSGAAPITPGSLEEKYGKGVMQQVDSTLDRYDTNKSGTLNNQEIAAARWGRPTPQESDANKDGRLSRSELAERYAARSSGSRTSSSDGSKKESSDDKSRTSSSRSSSRESDSRSSSSRSTSSRSGGGDLKSRMEKYDTNVKSRYDKSSPEKTSQNDSDAYNSGSDRYKRYADALLKQYDKDKDNKLSKSEIKTMRRPPGQADSNGDGMITRDELIDSITNPKKSEPSASRDSEERSSRSTSRSRFSDRNRESSDSGSSASSSRSSSRSSSSRVSFSGNDTNKDGQLQMHEFARDWDAKTLEEFKQKDKNNDGIITRSEWTGR